jgi:prepilin-type N-terminal cleavage/methylation domain-containing protein
MDRGVTLVEILVTVALIAIVSATLFQIFLAIERYQRDIEDESDAIMELETIQNLFTAEPAGWETDYYGLYGLDEPEEGSTTLYYDSAWTLLTSDQGAVFEITYTHANTPVSEYAVWSLEITSVTRNGETLIDGIDFGRMGVYA